MSYRSSLKNGLTDKAVPIREEMITEDRKTLTRAEKRPEARRIGRFISKMGLSIFLLIMLIFWKDNGHKALDLFWDFNWQFLLPLLSLTLIMAWVSCLKWNLFLRERGINVTIVRLIGLYIIGYFFNNFFPSMVGGDFTRIYLLGRQINSKSKSAASVFLERFTGLIALLFLALIFSLLNLKLLYNPVIGLSIGFLGLICITILVFFFYPSLIGLLSKKLGSMNIPNLKRFFSKIQQVYNDIAFFRDRPKTFIVAMNYSFIFHMLTSVNAYICCLSLGCNVSFLTIAVITPIILLVNNIPVSFNNIGWWEWSFSVLFMDVGMGAELGLAVALILRGITFIFSVVGGVLFLFERPS